METRALAIAFFYAIGTAIGGISGPLLFSKLIATGEESQVAIGFFLGAGVMALGGIVELLFGVKAEQAELEDIAKPLTAEEAEQEEPKAEATPRAQRRSRFGPGRTSSSPGMAVSAPVAEVELPTRSSASSARSPSTAPPTAASSPAWSAPAAGGPGHFSAALHEAVLTGRARRLARSRFGPPEA